MKKSLTLLVLTIFLSFQASAQFGMPKPEDANKIKERTLLVVLDEVNEKLKKKIEKKPEKFQNYADEINAYNENLKRTIKNTWNFSSDIRYVTKSEFIKIRKNKKDSKSYAYFTNNVQRSPDRLLSSSNSISTPDIYTLDLGLADEKKPFHSMMYTTSHPGEADLTFILQQFQNLLVGLQKSEGKKRPSRKEMKAEFAKNAKKIKEKTLLFDKEKVEKKLLSQISKIYKFDYELTDRETIDKAILSRDSKYAYVRAFPMYQQNSSSSGNAGKVSVGFSVSKLMYIQYVVDAENGELLAYAAPATVGLGGNLATSTKSSNEKTSVKDLKKIVETMK